MQRHVYLLIVVLALPLAGAPARADEPADCTLSGQLKHNSADQSGRMPYVLLDRGGEIQSYIRPATGVELEPLLGRQVVIHGTMGPRTRDGLRVVSADDADTPERMARKMAAARTQRAANPNTEQRVRAVQHVEEIAPPRDDQASGTAYPHTTARGTNRSLDGNAATYPNTAERNAGRPNQGPYRQDSPNQDPAARRYPNTGVRANAAYYQDSNNAADPRMASRSRAPRYDDNAPGGRYPVRRAQAEGPVPEAQQFPGPVAEGSAGCGCGGPGCGEGCSSCGACGPCEQCGGCCDMSCGGPTQGWWANIDYLLWWMRGMGTPPLVTEGSSVSNPGYLGTSGTKIIFGDSPINDMARSGGRLQVGTWLDCCHDVGVEGEYEGLQNASTNFSDWSSGDPIISRPFYDVTRPASDPQNVEKVAFPRGNSGSVDGSVSVNALTRFQGAGVDLKLFMGGCDQCCWGFRRDFLVGFRFLRLDDRLAVVEDLTSTDPTDLGAFRVEDDFSTKNSFYGAQLGFSFERHRGPWSFQFLPKLSFGNTHQAVNIGGTTATTAADGTTTLSQGGLLALSSNIGNYSRDVFSVVPEIGLNLGYQWSPHIRSTFGYSFLYWSNVARAGDQIDTRVNPDLLPGSGATANSSLLFPKFAFQETGFWAQGLNFGLDFSW